MDDSINKHLQDILDAVNEVESFFGDRPKYFGELSTAMTVFQPIYFGV